mgnify:CR=1 FL=1
MINYENNRIIDFDSSICNYTEDQTTIHQFRELPQNTKVLCFVNPEALLVNRNTLVVPEAVRLSDGTLEHHIKTYETIKKLSDFMSYSTQK